MVSNSSTAMSALVNDNLENNEFRIETALSFLDLIKQRYGPRSQVYYDFLNVMMQFKSNNINMQGAISRVMNLFKDSPELIQGFSAFLPPDYLVDTVQSNQPSSLRFSANGRIPSPTSSQNALAPEYTFNDAIRYVNKVKERFRDQPHKYRHFLEILHKYQRDVRSSREDYTRSTRRNRLSDVSRSNDVFLKITRLFENHEDLIREFCQILPPADSSNSDDDVAEE